jgi:hypothetical protein
MDVVDLDGCSYTLVELAEMAKGGTPYYYAGSPSTIVAFTAGDDGVTLSLHRFNVTPAVTAGETVVGWSEFEDLARGVAEIQAARTRDMG